MVIHGVNEGRSSNIEQQEILPSQAADHSRSTGEKCDASINNNSLQKMIMTYLGFVVSVSVSFCFPFPFPLTIARCSILYSWGNLKLDLPIWDGVSSRG